MPKKLEVSIVVNDNCDKEDILKVIYMITSNGYFVINAKLENELEYINGGGFKEL